MACLASGEPRQISAEGQAGLPGRPSADPQWEDKEGKKNYTTEVICDANDIILLASGRGGEAGGGGDYQQHVTAGIDAAQRAASATAGQPRRKIQVSPGYY